MRLYEKDAPCSKRKEISGRSAECRCGIRWLRRERIWNDGRGRTSPGVTVERKACGCRGGLNRSARKTILCRRGRRLQTRIAYERLAVKRRRAIELQVVFALEHIVKDAKASANAGLGRVARTPRKTDAGGEIVLVGEICSSRRSRIPRKNQAQRGIGEPRGLVSRNNGEVSFLRVELRRAVLVANPQS